MKKAVLVGVVIAVAIAAILYLRRGGSRGPEGVLRISGNIELTEVQVSFQVPGRVTQRLVDEGALVRQGDLVARLDAAELTQALEAARGEEAAAAAALAELKAGSRREELAQGEALLARAEAEAKRLATDYQRDKVLFGKEVIPKRELDAALAASDSAAAGVRERREALALLRKGPRREQIDQAQARLAAARARVASAQERLDWATLRAPIGGVVLSKSIEPGEQVAAGTPVVTLGDTSQCWLKGYIPENQLGRVKLGQAVRVTTDSHPGKVYPGQVSFISSEAEFTPKSVQTEKERVKLVYRIKVTLANPGLELKPGMPADAEIQVGGTR
ncbi:HlyD family secretion protein [Geomonas silvestris]|uniref:HlyD family secretion protein n=1 Tax=Geomonas silvestris TaxID=2740184 RepID=UPI001607CA0C|nr:efflux RND transporter periplasmic adaptor subunit [Geomonas silvestris]